jgi:integrase
MDMKLRYVSRDIDRHGNVRLYYRRDGVKIRLRSPLGSSEFLEEYRLASLGRHPSQLGKVEGPRTSPGSLRELVEGYYQSAAYLTLGERTRRVRRQLLDRFCEYRDAGSQPFRDLEPRHLMMWRDSLIDTPEAANGVIKALRQVYGYAVEYGLHDKNPAALVKNLPSNGDGHIPWTEEDVAKFAEVHPVGSMARLSMSLALFLGQRKGDLIRLGRQHIRMHDGREGLEFTQQKNRENNPVSLWVPVAPELREIIDASPTGDLTFIQSHFARPFTEGGFGNRFRKWCDAAGLYDLSVHGLRKTAANVLAEHGCTDREIMSITGHKTSKEVTRYTEKARQKIRAANAIGKISRNTDNAW